MKKLLLTMSLVASLTFPAAAGATVATVNSNGDAPDIQNDLSCDTSPSPGEQCTLRAAIQTVNFSSDFNNTISFTGLPADQHTITLTAPLPEIQKPAIVAGNGVPCTTTFDPQPCVEVTYPAATASPVLSFNLPTTPIDGQLIGAQGLALTNGSVGLRIAGRTRNMFVTNMWIGLHLDASAGPNGVGIAVEGDLADGNVIGGESTAARNVIAHNTRTGVEIEGADSTIVRGRYIGTKPNGTTGAGNGSSAGLGANI